MADEQQALEEFTRKMQEVGGATDGMIKSLKDAENSLGNFAKKSLSDVASGVKSFSGSVINGSKDFDALIPVVDALGSAMAGLAGSIPLVGGATAKFVEGATEASKFLIGELGKQIGTFQSVSKSGVIAAGGMTAFSKQAFGSRLTLQQFGRVVTDNSKALAAMSGSAYDGVDTFSQVTSRLTDNEGMFARRLGMSAEEINDMTAGFMKQQTRLGRTQGRGTEELLGTTTTYIKELDLLSKITGENRQELQKQQEATLRETRFSAMVAGMKQEEGKKLLDFVSVIGSSSPRIAAGMKDLLTAGTATTEEGRQLMMLSGGRARDIAKQLQSGAIDQVTATKMLQDAIGPNLERFRGLSSILGDSNEMTAGFAENLAFATRELTSYAELVEQSNKQMDGSGDKMITDMTKAQKDIEDFALNLNEMILDLMPTTAKITSQLTSVLKDVSKLAKDGFDRYNDDEGGFFDKLMSAIGLGTTKEQRLAVRMANGGIGVSDEDKQAYRQGLIEKREKAGRTANASGMGLVPEYASGGIANFNKSGELAMLHGTEAVVPLPDGKTIPITFNTEEMARVLQSYYIGQKDAMSTGGVAMTNEARMLALSGSTAGLAENLAFAKQSTLPGSITADTLSPAMATAKNEVQSEANTLASADNELMQKQNAKLDELIYLTRKQVSVSEQTRSQLM